MRLIFVALFLVLSLPAFAVTNFIDAFAAPPDAGQYWNPNEPGNGYSVDIDPNGNVFVQWFTYRADGVPVWYTMIGKIERAPAQTFAGVTVPACTNVPMYDRCLGDKLRFLTTGVLARVTSPVYAVVNGACPTCPPRFPDVSESPLGPATVEWFGNRSAVLTFQGKSVAIQRQDIATPVSLLVDGVKFDAVSVNPSTLSFPPQPFTNKYTAQFVAAPQIKSVTTSSGYDLSGLNLTASTTKFYLGQFVANDGGVVPGPAQLIVLDTAKNRAYLLLGSTIFGTEFSVTSYGELFIYADYMVSWTRQTITDLGVPRATLEWKFNRVGRPPVVVVL